MANVSAVDLSQKSIIFITGASRGIGQTISIELSRKLDQSSVLVLLARSKKGLEETKAQILEVDKSLTVLIFVTDLSKPDNEVFAKMFQEVLKSVDTKDIRLGMIVHNAGLTGVVKQTTDLTDLEMWHDQFDLNFFSAVMLNSLFIKYIRPIAPQLVVINISSLCGRVPFANLAMYGAGKAAREIFFKVLAVEEPHVIVLNYCPGPVDTDMFNNVIGTAQSEEVRKDFIKIKETSLLTTVQTVTKLLELLEKGDFKSGDTIDYFDE